MSAFVIAKQACTLTYPPPYSHAWRREDYQPHPTAEIIVIPSFELVFLETIHDCAGHCSVLCGARCLEPNWRSHAGSEDVHGFAGARRNCGAAAPVHNNLNIGFVFPTQLFFFVEASHHTVHTPRTVFYF